MHQRERHHRGAQQHGDAPAPGGQRCGDSRLASTSPTSPAARVASLLGGELQRDIQTARCARRRFQQEGGGRAHFAAQRKALQQPEQHRQQRRRDQPMLA